MRKLLLLMFAFCAVAMQAKEYTYKTVEGDPMQARIYTLDNGLTVYLTQNNVKPEIQTYIVVRAGSQNDPLETTGLAHYLEHLMFKGTKQYGTTDYEKEVPNLRAIDSLFEVYGQTKEPEARKAIYHQIDSFSYEDSKIAIANEFEKLLGAIGASSINAFTSTDQTCYHEVIPAGELPRWAMIESNRFQNLVIRGFHTELETVYEEFNMYSTLDRDKVHMAIEQSLYPDIPYRQYDVIGLQEHLKNPSVKNVYNFYDTYYRPNNVAICLSGDLEFDHTINVIDAWFGNWKAQEIPTPKTYTQRDLPIHKDTLVYGNEAPEVYLAWKLPDIKHEDIYALEMMKAVLRNGKCGLIDINIDQKQQLLDVGCMLWEGNDYSTFILHGEPKEKQNLEDVRKILLAEIEKLQHGEFSEDILRAIVRNYKRNELIGLEDNESRIDNFITAHIYQIPYEDIVNNMARKEKVTKSDIVRVANKYLADNYVCILKEHNENTNPPKIEKPIITPIETNRDYTSTFFKQLNTIYAEHSTPQFLDFDRDLSRTMLANGVELLYCQNKENDLCHLSFVVKKGSDQEPELDIASDMLGYLGTGTLSLEDYKRQLYNQAAEVWIGSGYNSTSFSIFSLKESMSAALTLMEDHVLTAKPDDAILNEIVNDWIKCHNDAKKGQEERFNALEEYGQFGEETVKMRILKPAQLKQLQSADLLARLRALIPAIERVEYYGPLSEEEVKSMLASSKLLAKADASKRIEPKRVKNKTVNQSEVLIAPYKANTIILEMYANWGEVYNPKDLAIIKLFNTYFGGSSGSIVYQEMREARGLCYSSYAGYVTPDYKGDTNYFVRFIMSQSDKLPECILTFDSICNNMPISPAAFATAKTTLLKYYEQIRYTHSEPIDSYLTYTQRGWEYDLYKDIYEEIQKLTLEDVLAFQKKHIANRACRYMILGDPKELDMNFLKTLGTVKKLTLKDIFVY